MYNSIWIKSGYYIVPSPSTTLLPAQYWRIIFDSYSTQFLFSSVEVCRKLFFYSYKNHSYLKKLCIASARQTYLNLHVILNYILNYPIVPTYAIAIGSMTTLKSTSIYTVQQCTVYTAVQATAVLTEDPKKWRGEQRNKILKGHAFSNFSWIFQKTSTKIWWSSAQEFKKELN